MCKLTASLLQDSIDLLAFLPRASSSHKRTQLTKYRDIRRHYFSSDELSASLSYIATTSTIIQGEDKRNPNYSFIN